MSTYVGAIFDDIEAQLPKYPLEVRERSLMEVRSIVVGFANKIRRAAVEKDRVLRGNGVEFPAAHDFGQWPGSGIADIEARISSLSDIYCDRKITIQGVEMSMSSLRSVMTDVLTLVKQDGSIVREGIPGRVTENTIMTLEKDLPIQPGDHFLRKLPSGLVEDFVVMDPGYTSGLGPVGPHFQTKVKRSDIPTASQHTIIHNITNNIHGTNARVNTNSIDNSLNIIGDLTIGRVSVFLDQLRPAISGLPSPHREKIATPLAILEDEIRTTAPSQSKMRGALESMKTIAEEVAGNLAAAGIVGLVGQLLSGS